MAWFYKNNALFVPVKEEHDEDPRWRQNIFGIKGIDKDVIKDGYYITENARKLKVREMKENIDLQYQYMVIDCYSYLFEIGNACAYLPSQNRLILIDERLTKRTISKGNIEKIVFSSDNSLGKDVYELFKKKITSMVDDMKAIGWKEGDKLISRLEEMLQAKGWKLFPEEEVGECCFCKGPCNPLSQACGRCARKL